MAGVELGQLNECPEAEFAGLLALLFEPSPCLTAKLLSRRPFVSAAHMVDSCHAVFEGCKRAELAVILAAHPRIGAPKAELSASSRHEQQHGGQTPEWVLQELDKLNTAYIKRHGFSYVTFVNGRSREDLLPEFRQRLSNPTADELQTGLKAMIDIAHDRLKKLQPHSAL